MTFEEFFKKKKINLAALQQADSGLFSEFRTHYEQMGEKSFDHTKKYWFNKLRRLYVLPPEIKAEKVVIENQIAEQTIADTLADPAVINAPKVGFKPRFKRDENVTEPAGQTESTIPADTTDANATGFSDNQSVKKPTKPGFTPRFKAGAITTKPAEEPAELKENETKPLEEPTEPAKPKVGFTPRFKAGVTSIKITEEPAEQKAETKPLEESTEPAKPKVGFTPRFKAGVTSTKTTEEPAEPKAEETKPLGEPTEPAKPKVGFTPRFKAGITSTKTTEEPAETSEREIKPLEAPAGPVTEKPKDANTTSVEPDQPEVPAQPAPKIGFKPRFKPPQQ